MNTWTKLFNNIFASGKITESWRKSTTKTLYKGKGDISNPNSFRGIALENNIFKIFTSILAARLEKELENHIHEQQYGFRKGRNITQAIGNLLGEIQEETSRPKGKYIVVFIDYTKAFDLVNREKLIKK